MVNIYNDMSATFQCANLIDMLQIRSLFFINHTEQVLYLSVGSVDLLVSTFNIIVLLALSPLKEPPSDILLVFTLYSILKILLIYITVIYDNYNPPSSSPPDFYNFCLATGFIEIAARVGKGSYTIILTFLYANKVKNPLKAWVTPKKEIHFVCAFLILLLSTVLYFTNSIGMTIFGYCGVAYSLVSMYLIGAFDILYLVTFVLVTLIFLRNLKSVCSNNRTMSRFFNYYVFFLIIICTSQLVLTIAEFLVASSCREGTNETLFTASKIMVNTTSCSLSFFVLVAIVINPQFKNALSLQLFGGFYDKYKKWISRKGENRQINETFYDQLLTTNRKTLLVELENLANLDQGFLANLKDKSRACFLSSVLGCFSLQHLQLKGSQGQNDKYRTSAVQDDPNSLFSWNFHQKYTFVLTNEIVEHYSHIFIKNLPPVFIKFTSYSPNVLYTSRLNISTSLSPSNNQKAIARDCGGGGDGGSSGQFFFFNYDRTFILKTISSQERHVFLQRLQHFYKHFKANPRSLIAKIYSVASVVNIDNQDEINFSLMSNIIGGINKQFIVRSYDMKGSLHKREVLNNWQKVQQGEHIRQTLKDIDFQRLEEKMWISNEHSEKLKTIIKIDSQFLCSHGLIDYSLLVIKLDGEGISKSQADSRILKDLTHYASEKENGMIYVLGIIDYLETWNLRKKSQKWYKSLFTQKHTISSQNPSFYSNRFISFASKILNN